MARSFAHPENQATKSVAETLDDFRSGLTCKICFRILYEPYTTQCGHTFCYSCLSQWFTDNNNVHKKTCPDCRAAVKNSPAPAYLVRDLAQKFVQQIHLFGDEEETLEQHLQLQQEEAAIVERDRASMRGLFKGRFKNRTINLRPIIHDAEDQVDRCPSCAWELEGERICHRCGAEVGSGSDSEEEEDESSEEHWHSGAVIDLDTDEDLDGEVDMEDADVEGDFDSPETGARRPSISARRFTNARRVLNSELSPRTRRGRDSRIPDDEYSDPESAANTSRSASSVQEEDGDQISTDDDEDADDDDDDDDGDSTMNDFVVDDEQETDEADDSESSGSTPRQTPTRTATRTKGLRRSHPFVIPSDDDSSESNSSPESDEDPDDDVPSTSAEVTSTDSGCTDEDTNNPDDDDGNLGLSGFSKGSGIELSPDLLNWGAGMEAQDEFLSSTFVPEIQSDGNEDVSSDEEDTDANPSD